MTTKEKIIRQSLKTAQKRLEYLENIQKAAPASDLIQIAAEVRLLLEQNKGVEARTSKSFIDKIDQFAKREKECWKMIEKQKKWEENSDEMVELMSEISDLMSELFYI